MRRDLKKIRGCAPRPNVMGMVGVWKFNEAYSQMSLRRVMFSECMSLFLTHIPYAPLSFPHHSRFPLQSSWIYPRREFSRLQRSRRFQYRSRAGAMNQMKKNFMFDQWSLFRFKTCFLWRLINNLISSDSAKPAQYNRMKKPDRPLYEPPKGKFHENLTSDFHKPSSNQLLRGILKGEGLWLRESLKVGMVGH